MTARFLRHAFFFALTASMAAAALLVTAAQEPRLSSHDARVNAIVAGMTLDEKVGQMMQVDLDGLQSDADVATYFLGSILQGGSTETPTNSRAEWADNYQRMQAQALKTRLRLPILYGVDAVHGHNNVVGAVVFPHNIGLGATRDERLVEEIGAITAREMLATGMHWTFAPCVAVPRDERWGRTYEGFSEDPALVATLGAALVRGLQGSSLSAGTSVLACAKHYLGDGGTSMGTGLRGEGGQRMLDQGDTRMDEATLRKIHMPGYPATIKAGVGSVMVTYSAWNGEKVSGHKKLITDVLKNELGFEGLVISDYDAIQQLPGGLRTAIATSINAGMDMAMVSKNHVPFIAQLKSLVEDKTIPMARIDDAVRRILRVKAAMGLLEPGWKATVEPGLVKAFGSRAHREVARRAVRESVVLLTNKNGVLPARAAGRKVVVVGKAADDVGQQCGGWTISWQGDTGPITPGTSIVAGISQVASDAATVTYSATGAAAAGHDLAVVVVGETPYAEMRGDRADLSLSADDVALVRRVKDTGVPTVVVILSGRPLIVEGILNVADAIVAAWLPGTEGAGVADVLFGKAPFTGTLPFTWPRSMAQIPINAGDAQYDPLFPLGHGLK
jgi:beta-glucosidase